MSQPDWTSPADLRSQLQKLWDRGELLRSRLPQAEPMFPLQLRLKKPNSNDLGTQFEQVRRWIAQLQLLDSRYRLEYREINHRQLGRNQIPDSVWIDQPEDALQLLGQQRAARQFEQLVSASLALFPALHSWLQKYPLRALEQAAHWQQILAVLQWFCAHPHSQLYLRQLDIPGVDTKFIELRRGLLSELLDLVLPAAHIDEQWRGVKGFCRRYGLLDKPLRIRMRILDNRLAIAGLTDLEVPVEQLAGLQLPLERVFVTENEVNALAFPELPDSVLLFGQGYALDLLGHIPWLQKQPLYYWGDIDTHGFAILNRLRTYLPHAKSMLMDHSTLLHHQTLWGQEPADTACTGELPLLTSTEQSLYQALRENRLCNADGQPVKNLRFEQELVSFNWLQQYLRQL
ncbi:DUF3322 domain-containing protein [Thiopseudomonas denitrificans]|uniref:Wadjet protein JetD C-terminal domain-containing protein n=1 Tax=Thiopseudomonas denitrificans TaxID=1501432 RepID=A0A4R6TTT8_9GAMM|nr:DUF3322 domain-containing protein [Thiopseudomonas denitrificans]TDQ34190.1 hypothetical protein DFQ45_1209 [Thiopseudomonas denitrificans]